MNRLEKLLIEMIGSGNIMRKYMGSSFIELIGQTTDDDFIKMTDKEANEEVDCILNDCLIYASRDILDLLKCFEALGCLDSEV